MPSNQTTNYQLSQWAKSDQVLMEDFNADNAKLDAALKAEADARTAAVNAINATLSGAVKLTVGSYTGDGAATRVIPLPFTPKAVYSSLQSGPVTFEGLHYGGLAVTGRPAGAPDSSVPYSVVEIVSGGFKVYYRTEDRWGVYSNTQGEKYHYIAIG